MRLIDADKIQFKCTYHGDCRNKECKRCPAYMCSYSDVDNQPKVRQPVKKKIVHDMGDKEEYCPICKIMLYDSFASKNDRRNQGIFDLANAKFCPKCGVEFE